jgi:hypothetical protein
VIVDIGDSQSTRNKDVDLVSNDTRVDVLIESGEDLVNVGDDDEGGLGFISVKDRSGNCEPLTVISDLPGGNRERKC